LKARLLGLVAAGVAVTCFAGCSMPGRKAAAVSVVASATAPVDISVAREQERRFAGALEFLRTGREQEARELLERVLEGPSRSGITDEALFRLALLYLREEGAKGMSRSQDLIGQLHDDYPGSIWTHQAAPLAAFLSGVRTLRDRQREVKSLKETNLSLSRDNRELRQSIERLKSLDLELDKKIKR